MHSKCLFAFAELAIEATISLQSKMEMHLNTVVPTNCKAGGMVQSIMSFVAYQKIRGDGEQRYSCLGTWERRGYTLSLFSFLASRLAKFSINEYSTGAFPHGMQMHSLGIKVSAASLDFCLSVACDLLPMARNG